MAIALLGEELLDSGEHHPSGSHIQQGLQMFSRFSLHRRLPEELMTGAECVVQLIVKVVAVRDDDERRIGKYRMLYHHSGVEGHGEGLAGALRVPYDAYPPVPAWRNGPYGRVDRLARCVELMVRRDLLRLRSSVVLLEDDEMMQKIEQPFLVEDAVEQHFALQHVRGSFPLIIHRPPAHETLSV